MSKYDEHSIEALEGLEAVRLRPGMYCGDTGPTGFHHLLWEIVDNAIDEAISGHAQKIVVGLHADKKSCWVMDDGRGVPTGRHPKLKKSTLDVVFTVLHAGGKFGGGAYKTSGGLHGVGSAVVNALSSSLHVESSREGHSWTRIYERGTPKGRIKKEELTKKTKTGTFVQFTPDPQIFGNQSFDVGLVRQRLKTKAYLIPGIQILLQFENQNEEFHYVGGVVDYLSNELLEGEKLVTEFPLLLEIDKELRLNLSLTWTESTVEEVSSFVNTIPTVDGGTHVQGLRDAVLFCVRKALKTAPNVPKRLAIGSEDIREGLRAVVSLFIEEPQFQGQTKGRLNSAEARGFVDSALRPQLEKWMLANSVQTGKLIQRVIRAAKARNASRDVSRATVLTSASMVRLPGKLSDCSSRDPSKTELFLVEGESAGGSAKQGRDRKTQAILALRGKVLNTEQATLKRIRGNEELSNIIAALGCGIGRKCDPNQMRYNKVVLLMDADSDGHHITALLLTFFYRYLPQLIYAGKVFLGQPPLFRIDVGVKKKWALTEEQLEEVLGNLPPKAQPKVTRFKGLGELNPKELWNTSMNPKTRMLLKVGISDDKALKTEEVISTLMGNDAAARAHLLLNGGSLNS